MRFPLWAPLGPVWQDRRGAVLPVFGMMVIILVVIGGAAIDISRVVNAREKLSYAIDAAALSIAVDLSGKVMLDSEIREALSDSFEANLADVSWRQIAIDNIDFVIDSDAGEITVFSTAQLDNYFIDMGGYGISQFGPEIFSFGTSATVAYSQFYLELSMALDMTNSIGGNLSALKDSASGLVDILLPEDATARSSKVRIAIVPYSEGVNAGPYKSMLLQDGYQDGSRCVTERQSEVLYDEAPNWLESEDLSGLHQGAEVFYFFTYGYWREYGPRTQCPLTPILPLTADRSELMSTIDDLTLVGGTGGQTGVAFAWYTLSPLWEPVWPIASMPAAYETEGGHTKKIAILMTDGEFNTWWNWEDLGDRTCSYNPLTGLVECTGDYDWTWVQRTYYEVPRYNTPSISRALEFCTQMKQKGIEIYTVFFEASMSTSAFGAQLMQECATSSDHYKEADSQDELEQAFANIAKRIQTIYLTD